MYALNDTSMASQLGQREVGDWRRIQHDRLSAELDWARRCESVSSRMSTPATSAADPYERLSHIESYGKADHLSYVAANTARLPGVAISREYWTSGSSGKGQEKIALSAVEDRILLWGHVAQLDEAGLTHDQRLGLTWPAGPQAGGVIVREAAEMLGIIPVELGAMSSEAKVDFIARNDIRHVVGSALYLRHLLSVGGDPLTGLLNTCIVAGEHYPLAFAAEFSERGISLYEWYGNTQCGPMAFSCRKGVVSPSGERGVLHVAPHLFVLEVLDAYGKQVSAGERGELVITALGRFASPLIRYRTGDDARFLGWLPCPCGRTWPSIEAGTIERLDDMLRIKGVNVWPSAIEAVLFRPPTAVAGYRGRLWLDSAGRERAEIELAQAGHGVGGPDLAARVKQELRATVGVGFDVVIGEPESTIRAFKQRPWTDERFQ